MILRVASLAGLLAATISSMPAEALAGDVPGPGSARWSGCYAGAHVGYAGGSGSVTDLPFVEGPLAGSGAAWNSIGPDYETFGLGRSSSAVGGVELGCDVDLSSTGLVIGGVVDFSMFDLGGAGQSAIFSDTNTTYGIDWAASLRARAGLAHGNVLLFVSGGLALADVSTRAFDLSTSPSIGVMDVSGGGTRPGWVVGGGAEWRAAPNWSVSLEYLHYEFDGTIATGAATLPAFAVPRFSSDLSVDTVRIGVKWRM